MERGTNQSIQNFLKPPPSQTHIDFMARFGTLLLLMMCMFKAAFSNLGRLRNIKGLSYLCSVFKESALIQSRLANVSAVSLSFAVNRQQYEQSKASISQLDLNFQFFYTAVYFPSLS